MASLSHSKVSCTSRAGRYMISSDSYSPPRSADLLFPLPSSRTSCANLHPTFISSPNTLTFHHAIDRPALPSPTLPVSDSTSEIDMSLSATGGGQESSDPGLVPTPTISGPWTVEKVLDTIHPAAPTEDSDSPLPFFHALERLKTNKREGWRRFGISRGESISDHMYRMSLMTLLCPPSLTPKLDLNKCMKMCLIHDMAESIVGDITPVDGVPKPEKSRREAETMDYLSKNLLGKVYGGLAGEEIRAIWQEYEDSKTLDSLFVHDLDKMELLLQMVEYEKRADKSLDLGEFAYVATRVVLPEIQIWAKDILKEREAFWGSKTHIHGEQGTDGGVKETTAQQQDGYYAKENTNGA
ncbi:HD domain-containing protein [Xylariomycetidae sp. FL2044]|nr:HD domain-containing protein [Xylariomycetidae sp. FL2044]